MMISAVRVSVTLALLLMCFCALIPITIQLSEGVSHDPNNVAFYLYPNNGDTNDVDLLVYNNLETIKNSRYNPSMPIIFYTSGFLQSYITDQVIKNAYLQVGFATTSNIIVVDWGALSGNQAPPKALLNITTLALLSALPLYIDVSTNVPIVGNRIQEFILFLLENSYLLTGPENIHLVGQSLGAHVMGLAGMYFTTATNLTIGRITGTEPAGPLFQTQSPTGRLDITDAAFVDIVHTNQGEAGWFGPLGSIDFFVNGGGPLPQPACIPLANLTNIFCSHNTAVVYYAKSILDVSRSIKAYGCIWLINWVCILLGYKRSVQFGEYGPSSSHGSYYLNMTY